MTKNPCIARRNPIDIARMITGVWLDVREHYTSGDWLQVANWCHGAGYVMSFLGFSEAEHHFKEAEAKARDLSSGAPLQSRTCAYCRYVLNTDETISQHASVCTKKPDVTIAT